MKYRKKPIVIEAVRLGWDTWPEMCDHAKVGKLRDKKPEGCYLGPNGHPRKSHETIDKIGLLIPTPDGLAIAEEGDWVIREGDELYPCKPDLFDKTYEPVV